MKTDLLGRQEQSFGAESGAVPRGRSLLDGLRIESIDHFRVSSAACSRIQQSVARREKNSNVFVIEQLLEAVDDALEDRLRVGDRFADDLQHFGRGELMRQRLVTFGGALRELALQLLNVSLAFCRPGRQRSRKSRSCA